MSDTLVVAGTFLISYGLIVGFAVYLHIRRRRAESSMSGS
jgi:xanthine/uracil/vitamin C permease (AzgA family)